MALVEVHYSVLRTYRRVVSLPDLMAAADEDRIRGLVTEDDKHTDPEFETSSGLEVDEVVVLND